MSTPAPPPAAPAPAPLPPLPDRVEPEALRDLDDAALDEVATGLTAAERATVQAMAPYERQLRELRARGAELATERRRRERAQRHAQRIEVRRQAGTGEMPTPLREVRAFLATGGEVGFGFPNKPGFIGFTDGRRSAQAGTFGEARGLWADGWEPGAPGVPGVRVHLAGTRIEKVLAADGIVVQPLEGGPEAAPET
ncbi:MAG: hypothetical protein E6I76_17840 [Chloroflexi bacterium]|nr:MAG: hypothetical protein E6I76_17840 [Chloroflexota bacterium]